MVASGVNFFEPTSIDIIKWGANYSTFTLSGDWWRLITSVFVHIGIVHIVFNMYALYMIGVYLEPMLGRSRYAAAYLSTGILASLASIWWHKTPVASAGASGAIFGLYGVFLSLLTTNLIPKQIRNSLLKSIGIFIAYNLLYGLKGNVDNAAHIGGLIVGATIGYGYYYSLKERSGLRIRQAVSALVIFCTFLLSFLLYSRAKTAILQRNAIEQYNAFIESLKENSLDSSAIIGAYSNTPRTLSSFAARKLETPSDAYNGDDFEKFKNLLRQFIPLEEEAIGIYEEPASGTIDQRVQRLKLTCLKNWQQGENLFNSAKTYNLSNMANNLRKDLIEYCKLQEKKTEILIKFYSEPYEDYNDELNNTNEELDSFIRKTCEQLK